MAEATATPARKATPRKASPAAAKKAASSAETVAAGYVLEPAGTTKTYAKFTFPDGSGCVGTVYAPLGTKTVKVRLEA